MKRIVAGSILLLALSGAAYALPVVVTPSDMQGWTFFTTDSTANVISVPPPAIVNGPGTPPQGTGSVNFTPPSGDDLAQMRTNNFVGTPLASITQLTYSTYVSQWNGSQAPYLSLWVSTTGGTVANDELVFEPIYSDAAENPNPASVQATPTTNVWQTWNALDGEYYDTLSTNNGDLFDLDQFLTLYPTADITMDSTDNLAGFRIGSGAASPSDDFDTFATDVNFNGTEYLFETPNVPEVNSGSAALPLAFSGLALALFRDRRREQTFET